MKKKMKYADKWHIPYVIIIGEEENLSGLLTLKNMYTGVQQKLSIDEIITLVTKN
jgi:histidyl-tRNA synthetase